MRSPSLDEQAADSLAFIRATMTRSAAFTAVPGYGGIAMGVVGLAAAGVASRVPDGLAWLAVWLGASAIAFGIGLFSMQRKAKEHGVVLWSAAGRRFAQGFGPAVCAGAVLTIALARAERFDLLPATWLLLYGSGVLAGAVASVDVLAWLGGLVMALGVGAAITAPAAGNWWLAAGFGGLHILFGILIARKHGG